MLANETDKLLGIRLETLEKGVQQLDGRVQSLDDKVSHVIQMNSELMIQSNENFREMRSQLDENRRGIKKIHSSNKGKMVYTMLRDRICHWPYNMDHIYGLGFMALNGFHMPFRCLSFMCGNRGRHIDRIFGHAACVFTPL